MLPLVLVLASPRHRSRSPWCCRSTRSPSSWSPSCATASWRATARRPGTSPGSTSGCRSAACSGARSPRSWRRWSSRSVGSTRCPGPGAACWCRRPKAVRRDGAPAGARPRAAGRPRPRPGSASSGGSKAATPAHGPRPHRPRLRPAGHRLLRVLPPAHPLRPGDRGRAGGGGASTGARRDASCTPSARFFGINRVTLDDTGRYFYLMHGTTLHGMQSREQARRREPLSLLPPHRAPRPALRGLPGAPRPPVGGRRRPRGGLDRPVTPTRDSAGPSTRSIPRWSASRRTRGTSPSSATARRAPRSSSATPASGSPERGPGSTTC